MFKYSRDKYSGIIFDFNGVLLWDSLLHEKTWFELSKQIRGIPLKPEELIGTHGKTNKCNLEFILKRRLEKQELLGLIQKREIIYRTLCLQQETFALSPGSIKLLNFLVSKKIPRTIATSSEITNLKFFIKHLKLTKWFNETKIVYDDGSLKSKPAPDMYIQAAKKINLSPSVCIVIEDSVPGIKAAKAAGIGGIYGLSSTCKPELLIQAGADKVIPNVGELPIHIFKPI